VELAGDAGLDIGGGGRLYWLLGGAADRVPGAGTGPAWFPCCDWEGQSRRQWPSWLQAGQGVRGGCE